MQTFGAFGMLCDKAHFVADCELFERIARDAIAVEINFVAIGAQDEAVILLWTCSGFVEG